MALSPEGVAPQPRISVITIFLNAERFLEEAIESVFAQIRNDWELLLIDDGSTDGSGEIARLSAARNPERVRYLRHDDGRTHGMSAARNLGLRAARGELVAFLDADDVFLPPKLDRQAALLDAHPEAAMVYGPSLHWYSWSGRPEDLKRDHARKTGVPPDTLVRPPALVRLFLQHAAWPPATCAVLVRKKAIQVVGGFDDRFEGLFEDQVFFYKLCLSAPVFVEGAAWDRYRQHDEAWTARQRQAGLWHPGRGPNPARERFLNWLEEYLMYRRVDDPVLRKALRAELLPYRHPCLYRMRETGARFRRRLRRFATAQSSS